MKRTLFLLLGVVALSGCSNAGVDAYDKSARVLGLENDVRVEAVISLSSVGSALGLVGQIENRRPHPIFVDLVDGEATYDPDSRRFTAHVGSELPTEPGIARRRLEIAPGQTEQFAVSVSLPMPQRMRRRMSGSLTVRMRVHFFIDEEPGADLPLEAWIERKRTVVTNAVPLQETGVVPPPPRRR